MPLASCGAHLASCVKTYCLSSLSAASLSLTTYCAFLAIRPSYCFTTSLEARDTTGSATARALLTNAAKRAAIAACGVERG